MPDLARGGHKVTMIRHSIRARVAALVLAAVAPAVAWAGETADQAAAGERLAIAKCARCHAIGRSDASPLAAAPPFRTIGAKYPIDHLAEAFAEGITTGHDAMPEFVFSTDEIAAILAYIERISTPAGPKL